MRRSLLEKTGREQASGVTVYSPLSINVSQKSSISRIL
jgi:hypothetical protein